MTELLVVPYQHGDQPKVDAFYSLLSTYPKLTWIPLDLAVAEVAARLRAQYRLKTPDALTGRFRRACTCYRLISNDRSFERVKEFEAIVLDSYL